MKKSDLRVAFTLTLAISSAASACGFCTRVLLLLLLLRLLLHFLTQQPTWQERSASEWFWDVFGFHLELSILE